MKTRITRRHALRSIGTMVSLPFLECMLPTGLRAAAAAKPPVRLVWLYVGSGMFMPTYKPSAPGRDWTKSATLPTDTGFNYKVADELKPLSTLEPLIPFKDDISILSGLFHTGAFKRNSVAIRHGQDPACHLTGVDLGRVPGVAIRNSISIDQAAARHLGEKTPIPSLSMTFDRNLTISYSDTGAPIPADSNPWEIFQKLFAGPTAADKAMAKNRFQQNKSMLDDVLKETKKLHDTLGTSDRERFDEYLTQLREIERRSENALKWSDVPRPKTPEGVKTPPKDTSGMPIVDRIHLLLDIIVLALQTDQTRVATAALGYMGDVYRELGFKDGYHGYTHANNEPGGQKAMAAIDRARVGHMAYFLGKMKSVKEVDGSTLLDNTLVHFGGGMGTWHESTDLPNVIAGHGGGKFKLGEHLVFKQEPLANLYVTMLQAAGVPQKNFADSTGALGIS
ncbi:MAG TPA: DUF1552 domain-containing protein [Gemmata sp.]|jgi:hypothetical protein|nr:DUF1552 domain-containing protein [Gemmata sp.]